MIATPDGLLVLDMVPHVLAWQLAPEILQVTPLFCVSFCHCPERYAKQGCNLEYFRRQLPSQHVRNHVQHQQSVRRRDHLHGTSASPQSANSHTDCHIRCRFDGRRQREHHYCPRRAAGDRLRPSGCANCACHSLPKFHRYRAKRSAKQGCDLETFWCRLRWRSLRHTLQYFDLVWRCRHLHSPIECTHSAHCHTHCDLSH